MNDRRLVELLIDYGKISYGMAYIKLRSLGINPTYELLKEELENMKIKDNISYVKSKQR